jgi:hypothetical protein
LPEWRDRIGGSIIYGYAYVGADFSDACLRRMDGEQTPWAFELNIAAMALAGVAWLTLVLRMRWQLRTKAVAALSGLATLALAGATAIGDAGHGEDGSFPWMLLLTNELSAVVALVAISAWQREAHGRHIRWRLFCGVRRPLVSST